MIGTNTTIAVIFAVLLACVLAWATITLDISPWIGFITGVVILLVVFKWREHRTHK